MKEFLSCWIIFQLVIIGIGGVGAWNKIAAKDFSCNEEMTEITYYVGVIVPLLFFLPDTLDQIEHNQCEKQYPL